MPVALFGIDDGGLNLAVNLLILTLVVIWIALIYWTYADAKRRIADPVLVTTATAASLFPYIGTVVYTILRPPEFLDDARERELETKASELRLRRLTETSCPRCEHPIELSWLRCPECQQRLKDPCSSCRRPVDPRWSLCPYCETPVAKKARPAGAKGRRRTSGAKRTEGGARQQPKRRASAADKEPQTPQRKSAQRSGQGSSTAERSSRRRSTKT